MKIRVLLGDLSYGKSNGISRHLLQVIAALKEKGIETDVLGIYLDHDLGEELRAKGIRIYEIPGVKHPRRQYQAVYALCRKTSYDIAYFNISEAFNCMEVIAAAKAGIPRVIVHSHNSGIGEPSAVKRMIRRIAHAAGRNLVLPKYATEYYTCSKKAGEWMFTDRLRHSGRYHVISNAVDTSLFHWQPEVRDQVRESHGIGNQPIVGYVGAFSYQKNTMFFLEIAGELKRRGSDALLWLIGDGPDRERLLQQARERGLDQMIYAPGNRDDVPQLLQAMDVFVLPSRFEGLPYVAIEAQCTGLRCILSDSISEEAALSQRCVFLSRKAPASAWADEILRGGAYDRGSREYLDSGYCFDAGLQKKRFLSLFLENANED